MKTSAHKRIGVGFLLPLLLAMGCSDAGNRATVSGKVTLDGKPLAKGAIKFSPMDNTPGAVTGTEIIDGQYLLSGQNGVAPGWNSVEITAVRKTGQMAPNPYGPPGSQLEMEAPAIAARYNAATTLKYEVKSGTNQNVHFDVHSE